MRTTYRGMKNAGPHRQDSRGAPIESAQQRENEFPHRYDDARLAPDALGYLSRASTFGD